MWIHLIDNPKAIEHIYGLHIPNLDKVYMQELKIIFGEDMLCQVRFDIYELPLSMPEKWLARNVNVVQINLHLVCSDTSITKLTKGFLPGKLEIKQELEFKKVIFNNGLEDGFTIKAKWINLAEISGYEEEPPDTIG